MTALRSAPWLASLLALVACAEGCPGEETPTTPTTPTERDVVYVEDDIVEDTTWTAEHVYVVVGYYIGLNGVLTIEPGTIVKFDPELGPALTLGPQGRIVASGTAAQPIVFTSALDDAHGGDTNEDADATAPGRADWAAIDLDGTQGSIFEHCRFYYGGADTYTRTLAISGGASATVRSSWFAHNDGGDPSGWYGALDASRAEAGTVIEDNWFWDNVQPLAISLAFDLDDSNTFHDPDDASLGNVRNGITLNDAWDFTESRSWGETEVAFVIDDEDLWIEQGATLTLADGVVLKFTRDSTLVLATGEGQIVNHSGPGVTFTSWRDDAHAGDTNGDGAATAPASGDWIGIYDDSRTTPPYYATWSSILYATPED